MIRRILFILGIVIVLGLIALWLIQGGAASVIQVARNFTNPISLLSGGSSEGGFFKLPWQPDELTRGPDISGYVDEVNRQIEQTPPEQSGGTPVTSLGNPSPYAGSVRLSGSAVWESDPRQEYVELTASYTLSAPVTISGWSLQSALSGVRVYIPEAAPIFNLGTINNVAPVILISGDSAIVTSGASPVGVSFRENECTGYLGEQQAFTPELSQECPAPSEILPQTAENLQKYGGSCFDYVTGLRSCSFPGTSLPSSLSQACKSFITSNLSYNGCVSTSRAQNSFARPTWRLFLNRTSELWNNSHDAIRLLDTQGRTVDVLTY